MYQIPYDFTAPLAYQSIADIQTRITEFNNRVSVIGRDSSNTYDIHAIEMGDSNRPTIFVMAGMHGTEWQGVIYSMRFMEQLRDGTFIDKAFRDKLLTQYHICYVPINSPWAYANQTRYTFTNAELNSDYDTQVEPESKAVADYFKLQKPFAVMDCHLFTQETDLLYILGHGDYRSRALNEDFSRSIEHYNGGNQVLRWQRYHNSSPGLFRTWSGNQTNPHAIMTLSFINEISRRGDVPNEKIMKVGMGQLYLFFLYAINYYETRELIL